MGIITNLKSFRFHCWFVNIPRCRFMEAQMTFSLEPKWHFLGIKTGSGGVCCRNAWGCLWNRESNPEADRPRYLTYCSHKPDCIGTTKPDRSVLITIIKWHFQFHSVNVCNLHVKGTYVLEARDVTHAPPIVNITWCPLTGIVASRYPSSRNAVLVRRCLTPLLSACLNMVKATLPQQNIFTTNRQIEWTLWCCFWQQ